MHEPQARLHLRQAVFRHGEDHGNGLHLSNNHQHGGCACLRHVSGVHQSKTDPAGNGCGDVAVAKLNLVVIDGALIVFDRSLVLQHNLFLVVQQLFLYPVSRPCCSVSIQVHLGLCQNIGVALQRSLGLQKLCLIWPRIDLDQRISFLNELPLAVTNRG